MRKILLLLLVPSAFSTFCLASSQYPGPGRCVYGDCQNGYGSWKSYKGPFTYEGHFKNGEFHGNGILIHAYKHRLFSDYSVCLTGPCFAGEWRFGEKNGYGIYKFGSLIYEGHFLNDVPDGKLIHTDFSTGDVTYELWKDKKIVRVIKKKNRIKTLSYKNHHKYIGDVKNRKANGVGIIYEVKKGIVYKGEFINNKKIGYGTYIYFTKGKMIFSKWAVSGGLANIPEDGIVVIKYFDGNIRVVNSTNLQIQGVGVRLSPDNVVDLEMWKDSQLVRVCNDLMGSKTYSSGEKYYGEMEDGLPHGMGVRFIKNPGRVIYVGNNKGKIHGDGAFIRTDGNIVLIRLSEGNAVNGKYPTIDTKTGEIIDFQYWEDGKLIKREKL